MEYVHQKGIKMVSTSDKFWECPKCGWALTFRLVNDKYVSLCPMCENRLEITKAEYEDDSKDKGVSFKHDYL